MSAICGIIHLDGKPVDPDELRRMAAASADRGPDGRRFLNDGNAGFVHLALHVTPESVQERQPLVSPDGRWVLLADCRIDNRDGLIQRLGGVASFAMETITDPAILLRAFQRWGHRCVEHLLGDFVFAVWDRERRELFLARDPLGGHGISYHRDGERFVFASETAAILNLPRVQAEIEEDTVIRTLLFLPPDAEHSFFRSIRYLPPAHCLSVSPRASRKWRYWDIDPERRIHYRREEEYIDHFLDLLDRAVVCRMRSIGPVGVSLSGGNDSTLIAACAAKLLPTVRPSQPRLKTFSYVFDAHPECDERRYIEPVVERYDLDANFIVADDKWTFADLERQPMARDFLWTNCYVQLPVAVADQARQAGCRVLLNGQFGDSLFGGPSYFAADLLSSGHIGTLLAIAGNLPREERWQALFDQGLRPLIPERWKRLYRRIRPRRFDAPSLQFAPARIRRVEEVWHTAPPSTACSEIGPGRRARCHSLLSPHWSIGMAAVRGTLYGRRGIEDLSPFFDRRLVEYFLAIPAKQVNLPGQYRRLQRDAMRRLLPALVCDRTDKTSYEALLRTGLVGHREHIHHLLQQPLAVEQGWIDGHWLHDFAQALNPTDEQLYALSQALHLELWLRAIDKLGGARYERPLDRLVGHQT